MHVAPGRVLGSERVEDAGELRQKALRWRVLARALNDRDDEQRIAAIAAEVERRADALSGMDRSDRSRHPLPDRLEAL
jgi:hypothetical protein